MDDETVVCPSCKKLLPGYPELWNKLDPVMVRNALSRRDNETYVCNPCGQAEAMADFFKMTDAEARANMEGVQA